MGKRKGAAKRAKKRADLAAAELVEQTIATQEDKKYEAKDDSELFVLDTTPDVGVTGLGSGSKKRKAPTSEKLNIKQGKKNRISEKDGRQIKKIMEKRSNEAVVAFASASHERAMQRKRTKRIAGSAKATFDLWDDSAPENEETKVVAVTTGIASRGGTAPIEFQVVSKTSLRQDIQQPAKLSKKTMKARELTKARARKAIRVEPAQPGQSYRPDEEQHQDIIGEALSIELRRKEAIDYKNAPIGGGELNAETLALIVDESDGESSDEEEDVDVEDESTKKTVKRKEKLTRAQRNKQKRVREEKQALAERRRKKRLMHEIHESKKLSRELRDEEVEKAARREEIRALVEEKRAKPLGVNVFEHRARIDPINAPSLPVALTEELKGGSLRRVKPKGSLLTDRVESMISRNMANRKVMNIKGPVQGKRRLKGGKGRDFILA